VCFRSIFAKGLRAGTLLGLVPFASLTGLSGGGVTSCGIALKLLHMVSLRFKHAQDGVLLFRQLVGQQKIAKLAESVGQMLCGGLALDLVVQDAHSLSRGGLLLSGQG